MLLYYITDRAQFPGDEPARRERLLETIAAAASCGVDWIQLREKDLPAHDLEELAARALDLIAEHSLPPDRGKPTGLLINSRTDVALASGAAGVHLPEREFSIEPVRRIWSRSRANGNQGAKSRPVLAVSCHSLERVREAAAQGADFAVFGPVFEKRGAPALQGLGIDPLREACRAEMPVLALGGVGMDNAVRCFEAGAAGIASIRLFQENPVEEVVRTLAG